VLRVNVVDAQARVAQVIVPDYQLSLAIGKEGQNARLAARLTGWKIDIQPDNPSGASRPAPAAGAADTPAEPADTAGDQPGHGEPDGGAGEEAGPGPGAPGNVRGGADAPAR
jgi:N utilization substance protein A